MIRAACLAVGILAASLLLNCGAPTPTEREPHIAPFPDVTSIDFSAWHPGSKPNLDFETLFDYFQHGGSFHGSTSKGGYEILGGKAWETDEPSGVILQRYRDKLAHPSWNIQGESLEDTVAWVIWTAHDSDGNAWFGSLVAARAGHGRVQVWMSLYSDELR